MRLGYEELEDLAISDVNAIVRDNIEDTILIE